MKAKFRLYQKVKLKDESENNWYKYWYDTDYFTIVEICFDDHEEGNYPNRYKGMWSGMTEPVYLIKYGKKKENVIAVDEFEITAFEKQQENKK